MALGDGVASGERGAAGRFVFVEAHLEVLEVLSALPYEERHRPPREGHRLFHEICREAPGVGGEEDTRRAILGWGY